MRSIFWLFFIYNSNFLCATFVYYILVMQVGTFHLFHMTTTLCRSLFAGHVEGQFPIDRFSLSICAPFCKKMFVFLLSSTFSNFYNYPNLKVHVHRYIYKLSCFPYRPLRTAQTRSAEHWPIYASKKSSKWGRIGKNWQKRGTISLEQSWACDLSGLEE